MRRFVFSLSLVMSAAFVSSTTQADVYELSLEADVCAIKTALAGKPPAGCVADINLGKMRSMNTHQNGLVVDAGTPQNGYFIHFAFDSDRLTSAYQQHLQNLSLALRSEDMAGICILLVGHTDAVGSSAYNQILSERRARSVKNFLVGALSMSSGRFAAKGHGEGNLLDGYTPSDAHHRRVEILARESDGACRSG
ncbi:OmpA family protein [Cognatishimia activa]|uniref:Outer membrane protein II n=1 Tax=Cognatishimia activa TaxID=1715691 RepID=A0A0P1IZU5_9RHOB|nr:OmpA family protein [Cognatishimia activa]CUI72368.1 Outer membrane protein II [Cognatishimia activa]CUK26621.1 Outer membrane protein II [Cognatishimia activa]